MSRTTPAAQRFVQEIVEDTEEAPWMVMSDGQIYNASSLYLSLRHYVSTQQPGWYVGSMLPLHYPATDRHGRPLQKAVAPDVFAARVPIAGRRSLSITDEGMPPFVLELVSDSSVIHDLEDKRTLYDLLGAQEYAIVRLDLAPPVLAGYRRGADGQRWERWDPDEAGRLQSRVLGLSLVLREGAVRAHDAQGRLLPTLAEVEEALDRSEQARLRAERARQAEAQARLRAETRVAELERLLDERRPRGSIDHER